MIGVSDQALAVCNAHYDSHKEPPMCCMQCPIESACRKPTGHGYENMVAWRDGVNEAAEKVVA